MNALDKKLQIKPGQAIAIFGDAPSLELAADRAEATIADGILVFVRNEAGLRDVLPALRSAANREKLTWVAYPKAKQLSTDLNRDIIWGITNDNGLDPVRQIAIDDVWSALRLKTRSEHE